MRLGSGLGCQLPDWQSWQHKVAETVVHAASIAFRADALRSPGAGPAHSTLDAGFSGQRVPRVLAISCKHMTSWEEGDLLTL